MVGVWISVLWRRYALYRVGSKLSLCPRQTIKSAMKSPRFQVRELVDH